jgi:hypothetical protein
MANDCNIHLIISHPEKEKMDALVQAFDNNCLFQTFRPIPEGEKNQLEFCAENWGTMKDVYDVESIDYSNDEDHCWFLTFSTAWTPPVEFVKFLHEELGFDVNMHYCECGVGFCGEYVNGYYNHYDFEEVTDPSQIEDITDIFPEILEDDRLNIVREESEEEE